MKINKGQNNYNRYENYNKNINKIERKELSKEEIKLANEAKKPSKEKNVNVQISDSTKRLAQFVNLSKDDGISERVETIKKAIMQGTYKVNDKTIAKKIMDNIGVQKGEKLND